MSPRFKALEVAGERSIVGNVKSSEELAAPAAERFGKHVFTQSLMKKHFPQEIYHNILCAMQGKEKIRPEYADQIACAVKDWAVSHGATHYTHWFQPWTGTSAEKHDSFIEWSAPDGVIERFNGKQLIQGEPDASSFPSGGLRSTYEARGYTGWDPSSPIFLWKSGDGVTLCIPSVFFSYTGEVLDNKIPLLRSDQKINDAVLRLLRLTGTTATQVYSTLGWEQEYFVIDRALRNLRPDLVQLGKTVYGAPPAKGQELQDHYFGTVKHRIMKFMQDFEHEAMQLGIPVKTRHNEVAPAQHEVAAVYEKASVAVDHNILLMELLRCIAAKHGLACLLHEKPFAELNGSGKHNNWSLATDTGHNLLDPTDNPEDSLQFLILLTAVLDGLYQHADLLRAAIGSAGNDNRLGGHEAPPAILSVYLGEALELFLQNIEEKGVHDSGAGKENYDLGLPVIPPLTRDNTDRNRTSPFAFTGNKFEFRAVGSAASCATPITVINVAVAESLHRLLDKIEEKVGGEAPSKEALAEAALPLIREALKKSRAVRFAGDNYHDDWVKEAEARGLPNVEKSVYAFEAYKTEKAVRAFEGILGQDELQGRYEVLVEMYGHKVNIEANLMIDLFRTRILPAATATQQQLATTLQPLAAAGQTQVKGQEGVLTELTTTINQAIDQVQALESLRDKAQALDVIDAGHCFADEVLPQCQALRETVDCLETLVDDKLWPLPKYWELLCFV